MNFYQNLSRGGKFAFWVVVGLVVVACCLTGFNILNNIVPTDAEAKSQAAQTEVAGSNEAQTSNDPTATEAPAEEGSAAEEEDSESDTADEANTIKFYIENGEILECVSVNGPWVAAFANGQTYTIDPADLTVFKTNTFYMIEFVEVGSFPADLHQGLELNKAVDVVQGNVWDCGSDSVSDATKGRNILWNYNQKFNNWDSQKDEPFHPAKLTLPGDTVFTYAAGEKPEWVGELVDGLLPAIGVFVCEYENDGKVREQTPAGEILDDNILVGTPGSAGCDFVVLRTGSSEAVRYEGVIERFEYKNGTIFFVFNPKMTDDEVEAALEVLGYEVEVSK